jgi:hypothetical protein
MKAYLLISQELLRMHWMVGILHGGFAKSWKPSDLAEEQGSYDKHSSSVNLGRNQTVGSKSTSTIGSLA